MTRNGQCQFCLEFDDEPEAVYFSLFPGGPKDRAVHRCAEFRVLPPLGQFIEGAVMIVAEEHVPSCAAMSPPLLARLEDLVAQTRRVVTREYGAPVIFEHGPGPATTKGTCCVDHAHLHVFPVSVDIHARLSRQYEWKEIAALDELRSFDPGAGGYLFLEQAGRRYAYRCDLVPSQLIRQIIAAELSIPERWHWRTYLGLDELGRTLERLGRAEWGTP